MKKYTYLDISVLSPTGGGEPLLLIEIFANSIIEADKVYSQKFGKLKGTVVVKIS